MHSFLIISTQEKSRNRKAVSLACETLGIKDVANPQSPDLLTITNEEKGSIGIEKVRELTSWLITKPFQSKSKVALIKDAHLLTLEAQNALLKTLEEPPGNSKIILTCSHKSRLLPTIVSRCAQLNLKAEETEVEKGAGRYAKDKEFVQILTAGIGKRLDFVEENKDLFSKKEVALETIDTWLKALSLFLERPESGDAETSKEGVSQERVAKAARSLLDLKKEVATTNVSPRNLIELFLIKL